MGEGFGRGWGKARLLGRGTCREERGMKERLRGLGRRCGGRGAGWLGFNGVREMTQQRWLDWGGVCLEIARWWL